MLLLLQRVILSLINSQFGEYVVSIYHIEIKDTSGTARSTSYFDIMGFKLLNCLSSVKIVVDYCLSVCPFFLENASAVFTVSDHPFDVFNKLILDLVLNIT